MSNRVCQNCGEEYSDTYKKCPFCEEDEAIRHGRPLRRQGGKRLETQRRSNGGAGGVMLLLTGVIILGALAYVFFGDKIAGTMGIRSDPEELGFITGEDGEDSGAPEEEPPDDTPLPEASFTLSQSAMTLAAGETAMLTVSGTENEVTWVSSDEAVAVVENGIVTAIAGGTATISAVVEGESTACSVEVQGEPAPYNPVSPDAPIDSGSTDSTGSSPSSAALTLSTTDFSIRPGETPVTLKVSGTDSKVTWASKDTSIATVSENGVVTRVSSGTTTITATVDGQVLECIVRCKS